MKWALLILSVLPCIKALDLAPEKVEDAGREGKGIKKFQIRFVKKDRLDIKSLYSLSYYKYRFPGFDSSDGMDLSLFDRVSVYLILKI